jgi:hypothetical protein
MSITSDTRGISTGADMRMALHHDISTVTGEKAVHFTCGLLPWVFRAVSLSSQQSGELKIGTPAQLGTSLSDD